MGQEIRTFVDVREREERLTEVYNKMEPTVDGYHAWSASEDVMVVRSAKSGPRPGAVAIQRTAG